MFNLASSENIKYSGFFLLFDSLFDIVLTVLFLP